MAKPLNYTSEAIYVAKSKERGRGVFTRSVLEAGTIIEIAPVIVMGKKDRLLLDQTLLHDYIFEWGRNRTQCCMALGYVPLYNHKARSNCEYEMNFRNKTILIRTMRQINPGEELFVNYHGDWDSEKPVWFPSK